MVTSSAAEGEQKSRPPLWLLGTITLCGTLGIHIFAPALALAVADLRATPVQLQLSISVYVWALAVGQLVHGPMADRFGRRPVLLGGIFLYTVSGVAAAMAGSSDVLIAARLAQALGGCSGMVIARAIVRDVSMNSQAARDLARLNLAILIGPGIGPLIGGVVATAFGWRAVLLVLALLGIVAFLSVLILLQETNRAGAQRGNIVLHYAALARSRAFLGYALGGGCVTTSWYAFIAAAPFLYQHQFGQSARVTGACLGIVVMGAWVGSFLASRLASASPTQRLLVLGHSLCALFASALCIVMMFDLASAIVVTALMFFYTCGVGLAGPAALAQATAIKPDMAGSASGLYGFFQMVVGAAAAASVSLGSNPGRAAAIALLASAALAQGFFLVARRQALPG
jgi:DHA1 family bicyclomycin/chloramphenicol resistance-like MFS transporter